MCEINSHELMRRKFWISVFLGKIKECSSDPLFGCINFADNALDEFDRRFPEVEVVYPTSMDK